MVRDGGTSLGFGLVPVDIARMNEKPPSILPNTITKREIGGRSSILMLILRVFD